MNEKRVEDTDIFWQLPVVCTLAIHESDRSADEFLSTAECMNPQNTEGSYAEPYSKRFVPSSVIYG